MRKRRKLFCCGTLSLLITAIIARALFSIALGFFAVRRMTKKKTLTDRRETKQSR